jgi:signal transduction histidine kinase
VQVLGPDGEVLASSAGIGGRRLVEDPDRVGVTIARDLRTGDQYLVYQRVSAPSGPFVVAVSSPLDSVRRSVDTLARNLWIATPFLLAVVAAVAWLLAGRALRPVEAIRSEVDEITHSTMHRRVPVPPGDDEVAHLATTMNEMLDRLEQAAVRQREFVSDASHELRSPLAAAKAQLEVALRNPDRTDWPEVAQHVLAQQDRLGTLVDDLLELARLDEGAAPRPYTDVDLDEMVLDDVAGRTGAVNVTFVTGHVSAGRVHGDARQLAQVVRNLVDNGVRHARSRVSLTVRQEGERVLLAVEDDGPGIRPEDRVKVFERFTRLDGARTRDAGGAGLGLALVRRIVTRHGGDVAFVDPADGLGGARVEARFPAP